MQKLPLFSCILIRNEGKNRQAEQAAMELMGASSEQMSAEERQATFGGEK